MGKGCGSQRIRKTHPFDRPGAVLSAAKVSTRDARKKSSRFLSVSLWQSRLNGGVQAKRREISATQVNLVNNEDLVYSKV